MSTATQPSRSAAVRQQLDHPVVDADAHWLESVPVFHDYLKSWELVEHEMIDKQRFRELTFTNDVPLHGRMNPDFFKGTAVETATARELAEVTQR